MAKETVRADQLKPGDYVYDETDSPRRVVMVTYTPIDRWIRVDFGVRDSFAVLPDTLISRMSQDEKSIMRYRTEVAELRKMLNRPLPCTNWFAELEDV